MPGRFQNFKNLEHTHSDSAEVPSQLKVLGEKTNLMALKGKLVLAGSTLSAQKPQP